MGTRLIWDEGKRLANIAKHGLDFADAGEVIDSRFRLDVPVLRGGEARVQSISYALGVLAVLTVIHAERDSAVRSASSVSVMQATTKERFTMAGSKTNAMSRKEVLAAVRAVPPEKSFVWNGQDEDDRPATEEELRAGVDAYRKQRGRPAGSGNKEQVAIRFDNDVLAAFRAAGPGWQTRMNAALRDWLKDHSAA